MKGLGTVLVATTISIAGVKGDHDIDCFVGDDQGVLLYYQNQGNIEDPNFLLQTPSNVYNNMASLNQGQSVAPECFDVDGDYDVDCLVGLADGTIIYYKNTGSTTKEAFTQQGTTINPFNAVDVGDYAVLSCKDLDNDGDKDCVIGDSLGALKYYKNTGTTTAPVYTLQSGAADDPFDGITIGDGGYATPNLVDMDGDLAYDMVVGDAGGSLSYYKNTGSRTAPAFTLQSGADDPFDAIALTNSPTFSAPECVDLDYDGDLDCFVGKGDGTIEYIYNQGTNLVPNMLLLTAATIPTADSMINQLATVDISVGAKLSCVDIDAECSMYNNCNNHGICHNTQTCACYDGWGSVNDIAIFKSPDCSKRTCPAGKAWVDIPSSTTTAHAQAECSNMGLCDRSSGVCRCFAGFTGDACHRMACPSTEPKPCSGHGECVSMSRMATMTNALPLSAATTYTGAEATNTWDQEKIYGCVCDSDWVVGLQSGETQQPEWFGPDCNKKRCPTGDDPGTPTHDETDCNGRLAAGGFGTGQAGNICHVDCSGRGACDHTTGLCSCYMGYHGNNCGTVDDIAF